MQLVSTQPPVEPRQSPTFVQRPPTFCAVGSGPARRAGTQSAGRVAAAVVVAATGLVAALPIGARRARCQEEGGRKRDRCVNSVSAE